MINRNPLVCTACGVKVITRTAIGHGERQEHVFPCPGCGVEISFVLEIDQKKVNFRYRKPKNGRWVRSEKGAAYVLLFDAESMVPHNLPDFISPFIATVGNLIDPRAYMRDESMRRHFRESQWPVIERLIVHFDNENDALFDKEAARLGLSANSATRLARLHLLTRVQERAFSWFTTSMPAQERRIQQRLALAESVSNDLFDILVDEYVQSGRMTNLWREIRSVRKAFMEHYPTLSPLIQMRYWHRNLQDLSKFKISNKTFSSLRQLYINCFEILCRLLVIVVGIELIIHNRSLEIPTRKGQMSLWDFEQMANGRKPEILKNYPVADLFVPALNPKLRNGIGHSSAHYTSASDEVVYDEPRGSKLVKHRMSYTAFCDQTLSLFSVLELAVACHSALHLRANDRNNEVKS